jgi:hypothetical protein
MSTWIWAVIVVVVIVVIAVLVAVGARRRRTAMLRDRFGPEYDRAVDSSESRQAAEADLRAREKERAQFDIRPLPEADRLRFAEEWRALQERFVDHPAQAADGADTLVTRVMEARGYPMKDFDAQAELVSVDHPDTVENYRFAHAVRQRSQDRQASTEDLREAMLRYRSLFDELLRPGGDGAARDAAVPTDAARTPDEQANVPPAGEPETREGDRTDGAVTPDADYDDQEIRR